MNEINCQGYCSAKPSSALAIESKKYCSDSPNVEAETGLVKMLNGQQGIFKAFKALSKY